MNFGFLGALFGTLGVGQSSRGGAGNVSALLLSQNWDGVTAPAIPASWVTAPTGVVVTDPTLSFSGSNSLELPGDASNVTHIVYTPSVDANSGDVVARALFYVDALSSAMNFGLVVRSINQNAPTGTHSYYILQVDIVGGTPGIYLQVGGGVGTIGSVLGGSIFAAANWYMMELSAVGTTITGRCRRMADGVWLNSSGAWGGEATAISVTNSAISGAGYVGVYMLAGPVVGKDIRSDDLKVFKSAATQAPATQLYVTPTNSTLLSGFANHRAYPLWITSDGSLSSPLPVTLSDGGLGGRFYIGAQSFAPVTAVTIAANTKFADAAVFYLPPYGQTAPVTVTASSTLGSGSAVLDIDAYPTTGAPTVANLTFDQVKTASAEFFSQWSGLPLDISGGFVAGLAGYTKIFDVGGGVETISGGVYSRLNASQANEVFYKSNAALSTPYYNVELQVSAWGGGATDLAIVGYAIDANNYLAAYIDNAAGTAKVFSVASSVFTQCGATVTKSFAAGTKFLFANRALWYLQPGDTSYTLAVHATVADVNYTLTTVATYTSMFPFWGTSQSTNSAVHVTNFSCGQPGTMLAPINTYVIKDVTTGAPLLSPDLSSIYVGGGVSTGPTTTEIIYKLNIKTWAFTPVSCFILTNGTSVTAPAAANVCYNPSTSTFIVIGANWENFGTTVLKPLIGTTTADLLSGFNSVTVTDWALPNTAAGGAGSPVTVYDADLYFDGTLYWASSAVANGAVTWTNRTLALASASSLNGTYTQSWEVPMSGALFDGSRITQIGGTKLVLGVNGAGGYQLKAYAFSGGASIASFVNTTLASPVGNSFVTTTFVGPHPSLAPVPGEVAGQTRYIFPLFNQTGNLDLTSLPKVVSPIGSVCVFEATQRYTSAEYTWITAS